MLVSHGFPCWLVSNLSKIKQPVPKSKSTNTVAKDTGQVHSKLLFFNWDGFGQTGLKWELCCASRFSYLIGNLSNWIKLFKLDLKLKLIVHAQH